MTKLTPQQFEAFLCVVGVLYAAIALSLWLVSQLVLAPVFFAVGAAILFSASFSLYNFRKKHGG